MMMNNTVNQSERQERKSDTQCGVPKEIHFLLKGFMYILMSKIDTEFVIAPSQTLVFIHNKISECNFSSLFLTVDDEFDFFFRVSSGVSSSIHSAEVHPVVPPHHLTDHQVGLYTNTYTQIPPFKQLSSHLCRKS